MKKTLYPILLFLVLSFLCFAYPIISSKIFFGEDYLWQFLPFHTLGVELIKSGHLPLWNSFIFSGMPLFANGSFTWFYPTTLLLFFLPQNLAINFIYLIHIFLAGYFTYRFCRTLGLSTSSGVFAGIAFMFSGNLITLIYPGHTMKLVAASLIPLIFYVFTEALNRKKLTWFVYSGLALSVQVFSSHWQVCYYTWLALFFYFVCYVIRFRILQSVERTRLSKYIGIMALIVVGVTAVQWLPFYEYSKWSTRAAGLSYQEAIEASYPPEEWLSMILVSPFGDQVQPAPGSSTINLGQFISPAGKLSYFGRFDAARTLSEYLGVLPFILAIIGILYSRRKYVWFFTGLAVFSLFLSLGKYNPVYPLFYSFFPGLRLFRVPAEILLLFSFSLSILMGTGAHLLNSRRLTMQKERRKKFYVLLISLTLMFIILAISTTMTSLGNHMHMVMVRFLFFAIINSGILAVFQYLRKSSEKAAMILLYFGLPPILIFDLLTAHLPYLQTMNLADFNRFVYADPTVQLIHQDNSHYRILPLDNEMISNKWIFTHTQSVYGYQSFPLKHYEQFWEKSGFMDSNLWKMLNIKYIVSQQPLVDDRLTLVYDGPKRIYLVKDAFPRAWMVDSLGRVPKAFGIAPTPNAAVEVVDDQPNRILIHVSSPTAGNLVLSEIYYPGWIAKINGNKVNVEATASILRSIPIPAGEHQVEFIFSPFSFWLGLTITCISIIILIISGVFYAFSKREQDAIKPTK